MQDNFTDPHEELMVETEQSRFMKRHRNRNNRRLHFIGWLLACLVVIQGVFTLELLHVLWAIPLILVFTFCGHYFCEGDHMSCADPKGSLQWQFAMFKDIITRKTEF